MHGAGHWLALNAMNGGNTICIQDDTVGLDPDDIWRTVERDKVNILLIDDQPAKLLAYEVILAELGENLIKANSPQEALGILLKTEVAVVLILERAAGRATPFECPDKADLLFR